MTKFCRKTFLILILLPIFLLCAFHQIQAFEAEITVEEPKSVRPGNFATFGVEVTNTSEESRVADIDDNLPQGWHMMTEAVEISPGESSILFVSLGPNYTIKAGEYELEAEVKLNGEYNPVEFPVIVEEHREIELIPPRTTNKPAGERAGRRFTIRNKGNVIEEINLSSDGPFAWPHELETDTITLEPMEREHIIVTVEIPFGEVSNRSFIELTAATEDEELSVTEEVITYATAPTPEYVRDLRPDELPLEIMLTSRFDDDFDPSLFFELEGEEELPAGPEAEVSLTTRDMLEEQEIRDWRAGWRTRRYGLWAGHLSEDLTPLVSASGLGAHGELYRQKGEQTFGLFASGDDIAGTFRQDFARGEAGLTLGEFEYNDGEVFLIGIDGGYDITRRQTLEAEVVHADNQAFRASHVGDWPQHWETRLSLYRAEEDMPISRTNEEGFDLGIDYDPGAEGSLSFTYLESWDDVADDPEKQRIRTSTYGAEFSVPTEKGSPHTFSAGIEREYERTVDRVEDVEPVDETDHTLTASLGGPLADPVDYRVSMELTEEGLSPSLLLDYTDRPLMVLLELDDDIQEIYSTYQLSSDLGFSARVRRRSFANNIRWKAGADYDIIEGLNIEGELRDDGWGAGLSYEIMEPLNIKASVDESDDEMAYQAGLTYSFDTPLPGVYSEGQAEGEIDVDGNNNPYYLDEITAYLGPEEISVTEDGYFKFTPLEPGEYEFDMANIPEDLEPRIELPQTVEIEAGETSEIEVPMRQLASVRGQVVWNDIEGNGQYNNNNDFIDNPGGAEGIVVKLNNNNNPGNPDEEVLFARTDEEGRFRFGGLSPGSYTVEVAEEYLPRRVEVHGDKSQDIVLDAGERREVEYVIQPIELEEERTFEGEVEIELESDE